jgi:transcription elongation GreA/GreB family factor
MRKDTLIATIIARLQAELAAIEQAARATHAEATHEENKAEDKYDTRGLEASYLAHGQSKAAEEAALALAQFQALVAKDFSTGEPVGLGALVVLEAAGKRIDYFIGPRAGGTEVEQDGRSVMVITPQSPLGRQLLGKNQGSRLMLDLGGKKTESLLASVS